LMSLWADDVGVVGERGTEAVEDMVRDDADEELIFPMDEDFDVRGKGKGS